MYQRGSLFTGPMVCSTPSNTNTLYIIVEVSQYGTMISKTGSTNFLYLGRYDDINVTKLALYGAFKILWIYLKAADFDVLFSEHNDWNENNKLVFIK